MASFDRNINLVSSIVDKSFGLLIFYPCRPVKLIEIVKKRFISLGGVIFEGCSVSSISIYEDASVSLLNLAK